MLPQVLLAKQALDLLRLARDVQIRVKDLPPERRTEIADDLRRLREITAVVARAPKPSLPRRRRDHEPGADSLDPALLDEFRAVLARLTAASAAQVHAAAGQGGGFDPKKRLLRYGVKAVAGAVQTRAEARSPGQHERTALDPGRAPVNLTRAPLEPALVEWADAVFAAARVTPKGDDVPSMVATATHCITEVCMRAFAQEHGVPAFLRHLDSLTTPAARLDNIDRTREMLVSTILAVEIERHGTAVGQRFDVERTVGELVEEWGVRHFPIWTEDIRADAAETDHPEVRA